jgi:hypothetical protein
MIKSIGALLLVACASDAVAASGTDFGVRLVPSESRGGTPVPVRIESATSGQSGAPSLRSAVAITARMGRVTSTYRSPAHNRYVGGVRNSYHLSGRAVDVVPRSGLRHRDIEAALLNAGYRLRESLDEGDHSHFAFDFAGVAPRPSATAVRVRVPVPAPASGGTTWKVVYAPGARR